MKKTHISRIEMDNPDTVLQRIADATARGEPTILNLPNGWDRLDEAIKKSGMKQNEVAKKCLISPVTFSRWKKAKQLPESAIPYVLLAKYLNVSLDWLLYVDAEGSSMTQEEWEVLQKFVYDMKPKQPKKK